MTPTPTPAPANLNSTMPPVYSHDNLRHIVTPTTYFTFILSTAAVGVRLGSRVINGKGFFLDDLLVVGASVSLFFLSFYLDESLVY
jgi:hypothetical protein